MVLHVSVLVVGLSWWFGGQSPGARLALLGWSTLGIGLFFAAAGWNRISGLGEPSPLRHLWPLLLFDFLVGASCLNPCTTPLIREGELMFRFVPPRWEWLPSSARPELSFRELWQFNGIVLSCYNVFFILRRRRRLRHLLAVVAANALVLAVFGTFQKLVNAPGLWFGAVPSPQPYFFATFVYHNHWGAFTLINLTACLGLLFHALRSGGGRDRIHSPVLLGSVALLFIAATIPLSGSRSSTLLGALLTFATLGHLIVRTIRRRRERHESILPSLTVLLLSAAVGIAGIVYLGRDVIQTRTQLTIEQLRGMRDELTPNSRMTLYADTWRMAMEKPVFGWGLESYKHVFQAFNSQRPDELWFSRRVFSEAHNDWLQGLAEVGFIGMGLLLALGLMPIVGLAWRRTRSNIPIYLLGGCGLVLLYAGLEFPFANPSVMTGFWLNLFLAAGYARLDISAGQSAHFR